MTEDRKHKGNEMQGFMAIHTSVLSIFCQQLTTNWPLNPSLLDTLKD